MYLLVPTESHGTQEETGVETVKVSGIRPVWGRLTMTSTARVITISAAGFGTRGHDLLSAKASRSALKGTKMSDAGTDGADRRTINPLDAAAATIITPSVRISCSVPSISVLTIISKIMTTVMAR